MENKLPNWIKPKTQIQKLTSSINKFLCDNENIRDKVCKADSDWDKLYMNLDLIDHVDDAMEYFLCLENDEFKKHSTIFIYGVLQSIFTLQDATLELHNLISNTKFNFSDFINDANVDENKEIHPLLKLRWHRNNLIGHPTTRNTDRISKFEKELNEQYFPGLQLGQKMSFFLSFKASKEKDNIEYATYASGFCTLSINLIESINHQRLFTKLFLENILERLSNM